ncbi:1-acylglycerol-3-phosphate O-acyltransferase [Rheinheimera riviphila]|uniref:1-acyl-sn-glycerol-3-phosphate acyltransferase n=1 Tax=Rheinheimera riviphila TaxID=1834037 RepID=A0A437QBP4_9GAMM|nr:1-acylglycerol-3-phosphate O-acyltransferase [Rheinheimera riviphila]RVU31927.1 1-acylglycerol-3-phosphate O-acyltransferase [Rheinheimera riviphila]
MLALIRLVLLILFIIVASSIGLLICLVRPFHRDNVGLFSKWYGKASWIFGLEIEIRQPAAVTEAMPCVFVANHQNNYDLFTISGALISGTVTIGKKSLKFIPFFGQLYWLSGNILIDRDNKSRAVGAMQGAVERIQKDKVSVWVFPEGTRSYGRGLLPFKTGAFHIAQQAGVPIVPICMSQTQGKIQLNRWNNGKVIIEFMPPLLPEDFAVPVREVAQQVRSMMEEKIAALDSELTSDYTAATSAASGKS